MIPQIFANLAALSAMIVAVLNLIRFLEEHNR